MTGGFVLVAEKRKDSGLTTGTLEAGSTGNEATVSPPRFHV